MGSQIIQQFKKINDNYEKLITICTNKFNYLKKNDFHNLGIVHKEEKKMYLTLLNEQKKLKTVVEQECEKRNIEEKKLKNLLPYYTIEEKEQVLASQKSAFTYEFELEGVLNKNARLAQAMMEVVQSELDIAMYIANKENRGSNSYFINEEL